MRRMAVAVWLILNKVARSRTVSRVVGRPLARGTNIAFGRRRSLAKRLAGTSGLFAVHSESSWPSWQPTAQQQSSSVLPAAKWEQAAKTDAARGITYTQFTLVGRFIDPQRAPVAKPPTLEVNCTRHAKGDGEFVSGYLRVGTPLKVNYVEPSEIHGTSYFPRDFGPLPAG